MKIWLIRHGATRANALHLYCGSTDLPLSEAGLAELKGLVCPPRKAAYITSGMRRTEQTLEALFGPVPHRAEPRFREVDFGAFEMRSYEELKDDPAYQAWISGDNEGNVPPGGESGRAMAERAMEAYREIQADTVVVTHGGVIAAIMAALFPGEGKNRYQWQPAPGHGYQIEGSSYRAVP